MTLPSFLSQYCPGPSSATPSLVQAETPSISPNVITMTPDRRSMEARLETRTSPPERSKSASSSEKKNRFPVRHQFKSRFSPKKQPEPPQEDRIEIVELPRSHRLIIHAIRWYYRLVDAPSFNGEKRSRALLQDVSISELAHQVVLCFTPHRLPGKSELFLQPDGKPHHLYAAFDSYLAVQMYINLFPLSDRSFFEVILGEYPQKPHFDLDLPREEFEPAYPGEDMMVAAEELKDAVISGCIEVLAEHGRTISLEQDVLLYSSHGPDKCSFHIVVTNQCHSNNREAKAFYNLVVAKVRGLTDGRWVEFVDKSVYSPRQQFRLVGCQKPGSGRPKTFHEEFTFRGIQYQHQYPEETQSFDLSGNSSAATLDPNQRALRILQESLVGFTSGCSFLPAFETPGRKWPGALSRETGPMDAAIVAHCLRQLQAVMSPCPFSVLSAQGTTIFLKRHAPSWCPICQKDTPHQNENPFMYIQEGKIYWDCRRCEDSAERLLVGYIDATVIPIPEIHYSVERRASSKSAPEGEFVFGDYDLGAPTLPPTITTEEFLDASDETPGEDEPIYYRPNITLNRVQIGRMWAATVGSRLMQTRYR